MGHDANCPTPPCRPLISQGDPFMETRAESSRYIAEQCLDAARLARRQNLTTLAFLLEKAAGVAAEHFQDPDPAEVPDAPKP
jgi:hypothetical protein